MTKEEADREPPNRSSEKDITSLAQIDGTQVHSASFEGPRLSSEPLGRSSVERTLEKAQKEAKKSERQGRNESDTPERVLGAARSPSAERSDGVRGTTLPVVEEAGEAASTGGRSGQSGISRDDDEAAAEENHRGRSSSERHDRLDPNGDSGLGSEMTESPIERTSTKHSVQQQNFLPDPPRLEPMFSASPTPLDPTKFYGRRSSPDTRDFARNTR